MKKSVLILLLFVVFTQANAQTYVPFPTDSAQWSVRHTVNSPFSQNSFQYKMKGDTLLNGIPYHKIYYSLDLAYNSPNQTLHCFVREGTTKKVFVKYPAGSGLDTTEFMLYDFNLSVGDTVTVKLLYPSDSFFKLVVTNIDSNLFLTGYRKFIGLKTAGISMWGGGCDNDITWIDGMGGNGLFYNEFPQGACFDGYSYDMVCFWHKGVYVFGGTFCDFETGVIEMSTNNNLQVYPNPAQSQITLEFDLTIPISGSIEIKNILGQSIKTKNNVTFSNGKNKIEIDVSEFSKGLYFVQLQSENKIMSKKFVKE